ncbi:MAG: hypothetical protein R3B09_11680 [Nannocystaceae bacterium]
MGWFDDVVDFFEDDVGGGLTDVANAVADAAHPLIDEVASGAVKVYGTAWGGVDYAVDWSQTTAAQTASWVSSVAGQAVDFSVESYKAARDWCVEAWSTLASLMMGSPPRLGPPDPRARTCMKVLLGAGIADDVVAAWERDAVAKGYTIAFDLRATFSFGAGVTAVSGLYLDKTGAWGFFAEAGAGVGLPLPDASFNLEVWMIFAGREAYDERYFMPGLTLKIPTSPTALPSASVGDASPPDTGGTMNLGANVLLSSGFSFRGFRVHAGLSLLPSKLPLSPGSGPMSTNLASTRVATEAPGYDAAIRTQLNPGQEGSILVTAMAGKCLIRSADELLRFDFVRLRSWKGDCLHRPDSASGVTTWSTGVGNTWFPERAPGGAILLRSWKGDYLHRPDAAQGVTTWTSTAGSYWTLEPHGDKVDLKSWKGDYLHRPDSSGGVTTWSSGGGSDWILEGLPGRQPAVSQSGWRRCTKCQGVFHGGAGLHSVCPAGGAHQASAEEYRFYMNHAPRTLPGVHQELWRYCEKCGVLHYSGGAIGACPAGGVHSVVGSGCYAAVASTAETALQKPGFRWCPRCQTMWFPPGGASHCPAGGAHESTGSGAYVALKTLGHYTAAPIDDAEQLADFDGFLLRSWKGDYLHRPELASRGVTSWSTPTVWRAERTPGGRLLLRSSKGDHLLRPDAAQGVTTGTTAPGNEWTIVPAGATIGLRSWKGDYLHRPDTAQGVTTWTAGGGSDWFVEAVHTPTAVSPVAPLPGVGARIILSSKSDDAKHPGARPDGSLYTQTNDGEWETWSVQDAGNGLVYLASFHGTLLGSRADGSVYVTANRQAWEQWRIEAAAGGRFLLTSATHGLHLGASPDGGLYTSANKLDWESWRFSPSTR